MRFPAPTPIPAPLAPYIPNLPPPEVKLIPVAFPPCKGFCLYPPPEDVPGNYVVEYPDPPIPTLPNPIP